MRLLDGLDDAQRHAVTTPSSPLRIVAGAGSGKTGVLTRRIAYRIHNGTADARATVAVTFTRRAAGELRARLRRLGVEGTDQVRVGTLHSVVYARLRLYWHDHDLYAPRITTKTGLSADDKRRRRVLDFEDVLTEFARIARDDPRFAEALRSFSRHIYVDEFQDVTPAQFDAVMAWVGEGTDLCVVGDPNQSIYGWNGADPGLMESLPARFPTMETVRLDTNYRSSPAIVGAATRVLGDTAGDTAGDAPATVDTGHDDPPPTLTGYATRADEAHAIARGARAAYARRRGWSQIAVLARTNDYLERIAAALDAARIPFRITGRLALLGRPAVRAGLDRLSQPLPAIDEACHLRALVHDYVDPIERGALHEVADMARDFDKLMPNGSVAAFREWLKTTGAGDTGRACADAVQLATFHQAKGLEWPVVFVAGAHDGMLPSPGGDLDEERRLLYVAMTRAVRSLHITHVGDRSPLLPDDLGLAAAPPPSAIDARAQFATLRRLLDEAASAASASSASA
jgi:DNA helicase-2/ATP-dependent DNA helicase PcrA